MALGTTASVLLALGAAGAGVAASKFGAPKQQMSSPQALPQPPSPEASADKASEVVKKKRAMTSQTVYSSPLGIAGEANVVRKTLTGQ